MIFSIKTNLFKYAPDRIHFARDLTLFDLDLTRFDQNNNNKNIFTPQPTCRGEPFRMNMFFYFYYILII